MTGFTIDLSRSAEIFVDAKIRINADPVPVVEPLIAVLTASFGGFTTTVTGATQMAYTLPAGQQVRMKISYKDKYGNPATIDGQANWSSSNEAAIVFAPVSDGPEDSTEVFMQAVGAIADLQGKVESDTDLGEGPDKVRTITTLFNVSTVGGEAVSGDVQPVGEPEPIP